MDGVAPEFGKNCDIDLCRRLDHDAINELVDVENVAVQRLQRVVVLLEQGTLGRVCWRCSAAHEARGQPQDDRYKKNGTAGGGGDLHDGVRKLGCLAWRRD